MLQWRAQHGEAGEKTEFSVGKGFSDEAAWQVARHNYWFPDEPVKVTDTIQANRVRWEAKSYDRTGAKPEQEQPSEQVRHTPVKGPGPG